MDARKIVWKVEISVMPRHTKQYDTVRPAKRRLPVAQSVASLSRHSLFRYHSTVLTTKWKRIEAQNE